MLGFIVYVEYLVGWKGIWLIKQLASAVPNDYSLENLWETQPS